MMEIKKYRLFVGACFILFLPTLLALPISIFQWIAFTRWKKNENEINKKRLEKTLVTGLYAGFIMLCIASVLFYHYGPNFIEVMGTFY